MRRSLAGVVVVGMVLGGCTSSDAPGGAASRSTSDETVRTSERPQTGTAYTVESLGLSFVLPDGYRQADDADLLFLARSTAPLSLFSIGAEGPEVVAHGPEQGESVTVIDLDGVDGAVVIVDAVLEGLPAGLEANELGVANGSRSFSVIMSAAAEDLPDLWDVFIRSVTVAPG